MTQVPGVRQDEVGAAIGHLLNDFATTAGTVLVTVGQRTGLWEALAKGEVTAEQLARRAGVAPAYARDWLYAMAAAGYVVFDPPSARFGLAGGFDAVLAGPLRGLVEG